MGRVDVHSQVAFPLPALMSGWLRTSQAKGIPADMRVVRLANASDNAVRNMDFWAWM
jgi:hypothetical protein